MGMIWHGAWSAHRLSGVRHVRFSPPMATSGREWQSPTTEPSSFFRSTTDLHEDTCSFERSGLPRHNGKC